MQQSPTDLHTLTHQYIEIGCVFAEKKTTSAYCLAFYSEVYDPPAEKKTTIRASYAHASKAGFIF